MAEEYIPATNFGNSSVANFAAVYKILWEMIKENLLKPLDDPLTRHERSLSSLRVLQKKAQSPRPELGSQVEVKAMATDEALASAKSQAEDYKKRFESEQNKHSNTWKALTEAKEEVNQLRGELAEEGRLRRKLETMIQSMQVGPYSNIDDTENVDVKS